MAEQSYTEFYEAPKKEITFTEPSKQGIYEKSKTRIDQEFVEIDLREKDKGVSRMQKIGAIFEVLASEEERLKHPETPKQKRLRELIENSYDQAELILGSGRERPSKPDGVGVSFDNQGRLVIDEIIESKSSENAFAHGLDKAQPPKTLETIGKIVSMFNRLIAGEDTVKLKPLDSELSLDKRIKRDLALKKLQKELIAFVGKDEKITFSPDLVYKLIIPKGVSIPQFDSHFLEELGYAVKMEISESSFSRQDIHRILEK